MSRPVRVLRVVSRMVTGGPARQIVALTSQLHTFGNFETRLLVGTVSAHEADYLEADHRLDDADVVTIPELGREIHPVNDLVAMRKVLSEVRRYRPDIVHTHTAKAGLVGRIAATTAGVPLRVHSFHGHVLDGYFSPRVTKLIVEAERRLARRTDRLVAVGERVRDQLLEAGIGSPSQYRIVPPGVASPVPCERSTARAELGIPQDVPVVAFVGRLVPIKRVDRLLDAFDTIATRDRRVHLLVAGGGPLAGELTRRAAAHPGRVHLLGWQSDVGLVLGAADVVVITSDNEGMPVSLIEGAMLGIPGVSTDVGSAREVVLDGHTGRICERSAEGVADAVLDVLSDEARRRHMGELARARAGAQFTESALLARTVDIYQELLDGPRRGTRRTVQRAERR